jgi:hypothetical protein
VNQKLSAVRKLAAEAAYNGLLDPAAAQAIHLVQATLGHASITTLRARPNDSSSRFLPL